MNTSTSGDPVESTPIEELVLRDDSSGRYHLAHRINDSEPQVSDACNIIGERTYLLGGLPEDIDDRDLCRRCFGNEVAS